MYLHWIYFFYLGRLCFIACQNLTGPNVCGDTSNTTMFCCKDHYQKGNVCVVCEPGFRGINCSLACATNYYGRLCKQECDCSPDEYCDNVRGCLCKTTSSYCTEKDESSVSKFPPYVADQILQDEFVSKCIQCFIQKELIIPRRKGFDISRQKYSPVNAMQKGKRVNELKQTETMNEGKVNNDGE